MKRLVQIWLLISCISASSQSTFNTASVTKFQDELNAQYADPDQSPLTKSDRRSFKHLDFFAPDAAYFVNAKLVRTPEAKPFEMKTSTARLPLYVKFGTLYFKLNNKEYSLNVYQSVDLSKKSGHDDYLFLPFSDLTSGKESYIGGRYIDLKIPSGDTIAIDFNKAYNPYCAYNHAYSCPAVPLENDLDIEIRAGVKKFHD